jgi:hypothetical protein
MLMESVDTENVTDIDNGGRNAQPGDVTAKGVGRSWKQILSREVRSHPFGYGVLAVALVTGPILITMIFPEVTPLQAAVGGMAFGVYLALCAVPQKFM